MIEFKYKQGEISEFAAKGTPSDIIAEMGIFLENVAFALKQGGLPDSFITSNIANVAAFTVSKGIMRANNEEAL